MADKYSIPTYSAGELIDNAKEAADEYGNEGLFFSVDYTNKRERRRFIKTTCMYGDTALFYQLRKVLSENKTEFKNDLDHYLIFIDFDKLFDKVCNENDVASEETEFKLKQLFRHGIQIRYENESVHYIPYEKSNSMSRQSKMSFIKSEIRDQLDKRLNLDIDFSNIPLQLSKYYAYKGLYLSTAVRVDSPEILLNSEKVVIINDSETARKDKVITGEATDLSQRNWKIEEKTKDIEIKVFDGEGLISPEYSDIINESCRFKNASSYQIRMPFAKGMLHRVDFKAFIKEYTDGAESFIIKDAFGIERDLFKAEIIMPVSMFKCKKWLEKIGYDIENYFEAFEKYDHALYISQTDLIHEKSGYTTLNYQILNTLDLTEEEFNSLIEDHVKKIRDPLSYFDKSYDTDTDEDGELTSEKESDNWKYALDLNPVFSHERKIQSALDMMSKKSLKELAMGKIHVAGEIRYLSRDLLGFLIDLLVAGSVDKKVIKDLKSKTLYEDNFFMPENQIALEIKRHYPVFRNPHLSRNEQCALKPYFVGKEKRKNDIYYRYFGHLRGVVMVSYDSLAPLALGGADFDGDTVRIIDDSRVRNAVLRGVYQKNSGKGRVYIRVLPVVDIPSIDSPDANQMIVPEDISFDVIKNTFSNKVGILSNLSIRIGRVQYANKDSELNHTCAECTILTGLEIDAAKHGVHPCLDEICRDGNNTGSGMDYIDFKNFVDSNSLFVTGKHIQKSENELKISVGKNPKNRITIKISDDLRGVDRLPVFYSNAVNIKMELPGEKVGNRYIYFDFLKDKNWKEGLDKEKAAKLKAIMTAFSKISRRHSAAAKVRNRLKDSNYEGHFKTVLEIQYDKKKYNDILHSDYEVICGTVERLLDTKAKLEKALKALRSSNWIYIYDKDEKLALLKDIFGEEPEENVTEILTNFYFTGYKLLYYAIIDELSMEADEFSTEEIIDNAGNDDDLSVETDKDYYNSIYNKLDQYYKECESNRAEYWKNTLIKICNKEISDICAGMDESEKLKLLWSLRGNEKSNSDFFWDNISRKCLEIHCVKKEG